MHNNKKAFTMAEILVMLGIISLIIIAEMTILNNRINLYSQPYYATYNALKKASYNILADMYCPDPNSPDPECKLGPREFPKNSEQLCKRLAEFLNTTKLNCERMDLDVNDNANNIKLDTPRIITSNAYRFHLSGLKSIQVQNTRSELDTVEYFVVYVDLNGTKRPNRLTCDEGETLPDIVPFAITRRGEVVPMGFPVYSTNYITAKIKYPTEIDTSGNFIGSTYSPSDSFYNAAYGAWPPAVSSNKNVSPHTNIPFSIMFTEDAIYKNSDLRQCYNGSISKNKTEAEYKNKAVSQRSKGCAGGTFNCKVIIDSSTTTRY